MKWRKVISVLCVVSMMGSILAGCGGTADEEQTSKNDTGKEDSAAADTDAEESSEISGTITVWEHAYSFEESLKEVIAGFEEKYPNVTVEYQIQDGDTYNSVLSTAIQSGEGPDLFYTSGTSDAVMSDMVANNAIMDLTDVVDYSLFDDSTLKRSVIDGKRYSIPWLTMDTRAVYYNEELFEENGWEIPQTFSEFENLLKEINDSGIIPISLCGTDAFALLFMYEPVLSAMDPEYTKGLADYSVKISDQPARDALSKMVEWADEGYYGNNWLGVDGNGAVLAFTSGEAAMYIGGSWDASTISDNNPNLKYGAFEIPSEDGTTGLVGTPANGFSVNAASENPDAALAFANYCASLEAQTIWVQSQGGVSASDQIEASTEIAKEISDSGQGNIYTSWQEVLANYSTDGTSVTVWQEDFPKVFSGDMTVDELMDELGALMQ